MAGITLNLDFSTATLLVDLSANKALTRAILDDNLKGFRDKIKDLIGQYIFDTDETYPLLQKIISYDERNDQFRTENEFAIRWVNEDQIKALVGFAIKNDSVTIGTDTFEIKWTPVLVDYAMLSVNTDSYFGTGRYMLIVPKRDKNYMY